jgi:hypothetical protein
MRSVSIFVAALAFGGGTFAMSRDAHALGPIGVEVGAKVGAATNPLSSQGTVTPPTPLGFGVGARGGVDILGFYGGVNFMYYLGSSQDITVAGQSGSVSFHTVMYGLELGYGVTLLDLLTIRPQIGIGNATFSESGNASGVLNGSASGPNKSYLYLEPGVTGLIGLGLWYVGADANVLFFPGLDQSKASLSIHGQIGIKF